MDISNFFCFPNPGKPDPSLPKPQGSDTRPHIVQNVKLQLCWYYTFNLIRERFKAPNTEDLPGRKFEKSVSQFKKEVFYLESQNKALKVVLKIDKLKELFSGITPSMFRVGPEGKQLIADIFTEWNPHKFLDEFEKAPDSEDLFDYCQKKYDDGTSEIASLFYTFLTANKPGAIKEIEHLTNKKWSEMVGAEHYKFLHLWTLNFCAEGYNLKISSWTPEEPIDSLVNELKKYGPLIVGGWFGPAFYKAEAKKIGGQINGRDIYGWTKSDRREITPNEDRHTVLLVGAKKASNFQHVYFIDPNSGSDPQDLSRQKIYVMSYERLTSIDLSALCYPKKGFAYRRALADEQ